MTWKIDDRWDPTVVQPCLPWHRLMKNLKNGWGFTSPFMLRGGQIRGKIPTGLFLHTPLSPHGPKSSGTTTPVTSQPTGEISACGDAYRRCRVVIYAQFWAQKGPFLTTFTHIYTQLPQKGSKRVILVIFPGGVECIMVPPSSKNAQKCRYNNPKHRSTTWWNFRPYRAKAKMPSRNLWGTFVGKKDPPPLA